MIRYFFQAGLFAVAVAACTSCGGRASQAERDKTAVSTAVETKSMIELKDYGAEPAVLDIEAYTLGNENFRTALWTGTNLQVTLMTIPVGGEVGLELHPDIDQFLRIEEGEAKVMMGTQGFLVGATPSRLRTSSNSGLAMMIPIALEVSMEEPPPMAMI